MSSIVIALELAGQCALYSLFIAPQSRFELCAGPAEHLSERFGMFNFQSDQTLEHPFCRSDQTKIKLAILFKKQASQNLANSQKKHKIKNETTAIAGVAG